jgi:NAD(P)-dependent dehydrogenase (short-subunit alcohol dehydrogenase family)
MRNKERVIVTGGAVVVITGASAGVGRAAAVAFARRGARVGLIARGRERLESARAEVEAAGGEALVLVADVADSDEVEDAAATVEGTLGPIDIWVNNAMATVFSPVRKITAAEFRRATEVTYLGYVWGTMAALQRMLPRDRGTIVQVGSALAYRAIPLQAPYCAAKHAIQGFTESLRCELLHDGSRVHVTMVQLPALNTPQFDWGRNRMPRKPQPVPPIYQPEVAADAIVWAAHARRREVYVGGSTLLTVVGDKVAPGLGDRYLAKTGYDAQQTQEPAGRDGSDNLFDPVQGDPGAHGRFDARALTRSFQLELTKHRAALGAAAVLAGARLVRGSRR